MKIYLMSAVVMTVIVAVMCQMRAAEAFSPAGPGLRHRLCAAAAGLCRGLRRIVNNWVAAMIAYRERQVTLSVLAKLSDPELKDFGVYRGSPGSAFHRHRDVKVPSTR